MENKNCTPNTKKEHSTSAKELGVLIKNQFTYTAIL